MANIALTAGFISDPRWVDISCINGDGTLNEERFRWFCSTGKEMGANIAGWFPAFHPDGRFHPQTPDARNYCQYNFKNGAYDLTSVNAQYYENVQRMGEIVRSLGMRPLIKLYDRCHGAAHIKNIQTPYNLNSNGVKNMAEFFIKKQALIKKHVSLVVERIGRDALYELCNEHRTLPKDGARHIFNALILNGVPPENIIAGYEILKRGEFTPDYASWIKYVIEGSLKGSEYYNCGMYLPIHEIDKHGSAYGIRLLNGLKMLFSTDGSTKTMNADQIYNYARYLTERFGVEHVRNNCIFEFLLDHDNIKDLKAFERGLKSVGVITDDTPPPKPSPTLPPPANNPVPKPPKKNKEGWRAWISKNKYKIIAASMLLALILILSGPPHLFTFLAGALALKIWEIFK